MMGSSSSVPFLSSAFDVIDVPSDAQAAQPLPSVVSSVKEASSSSSAVLIPVSILRSVSSNPSTLSLVDVEPSDALRQTPLSESIRCSCQYKDSSNGFTSLRVLTNVISKTRR